MSSTCSTFSVLEEATEDDPFIIPPGTLVYPICGEGHNRSVALKAFIDGTMKFNVKTMPPLGCRSLPDYLYRDSIEGKTDDSSHAITVGLDNNVFMIFSSNANTVEGDAFEAVYGYPRGPLTENMQCQIIKSMAESHPVTRDGILTTTTDEEVEAINYFYQELHHKYWHYPTDEAKIFILFCSGPDAPEKQIVLKHAVAAGGILVCVYMEDIIAHPQDGIAPFSEEAYKAFNRKMSKLFKCRYVLTF